MGYELTQKWISLSLQEKIDYLIIVIPIVLSVIALYISVITARKQNRISLFEKRYVVLTQIHTLITFATVVRDCDKPNIICELFDLYFDSNICSYSGEERILNAVAQNRKVSNIIFQSKFLFRKKKTYEHIAEIITLFSAIVTDSAANKTNLNKINMFCQKCDDFYKIDYPKLSKQTHL